MAQRAGRPCRFRGCSSVVYDGGGYCEEHAGERPRRWDERPSAARRGYGHQWRRIRMMVLARRPLCADPFGEHHANGITVLATDVHHVIPLSSGMPLRILNDESNLQPLCHSCHSRITAAETGGGAVRERGRQAGGGAK